MKFVIVEGIPGSGKSTTARFISLQYERNGFDAVLYWERFVSERLDEDGVVVLESPLFQTPILYLLHKDINRPDILRFINRIYAVIGRTDSLGFRLSRTPRSMRVNWSDSLERSETRSSGCAYR